MSRMSKFKVEATTHHNPEEFFEKVSHFLKNNQQLRSFDKEYSYEPNRSQLSGTLSSRQFKAEMQVSQTTDGKGAHVEIVVTLPPSLFLMKGLIQKTLQTQLQNQLQKGSL